MKTKLNNEIEIQEKKVKLSEAATHSNVIKQRLAEIKSLGILPANQIQDMHNQITNLMDKAYKNVEKEERMSGM